MIAAPRLPTRRTLLRAVTRRDPAWDGVFVFAVRTTGVACRPTCPSRRARPEHLSFFPTLAEARNAGFRPCRRCRPERRGHLPAWWPSLESLVRETDPRQRISDADLASHGFDPVVVRRHCLRHLGMTFHAWRRSHLMADAQQRLRRGATLDRVIGDSAWQSHSGFRDAFARAVGGPPGRARDGEPVMAATWISPVGPIVAAAIDEGIVLAEFGDLERLQKQAPALRRWYQGPVVPGNHPHLMRFFEELEQYFAGHRHEFTVPLVVRGTPFESAVWGALRRIPFGETRSYAEIAAAIGNPKAVRAVGSANGRNRIVIAIPCHRVINADGRLGGYGGGLWRKVRLLEVEGVTP